jgi:hypothetical protein
MFASDDSGQIIDAEFIVEREEDQLPLILSSASGPAGTRPARNTAYRPALALLLARLRDLDAVIQDTLVDSRSTQRHGTLEAQRRLISSRSGSPMNQTSKPCGSGPPPSPGATPRRPRPPPR